LSLFLPVWGVLVLGARHGGSYLGNGDW
jgi:hypothetical protein